LPAAAPGWIPAFTPELDFTYMLSPNWGLELILASSEHDASGTGSIAGLGKLFDARTRAADAHRAIPLQHQRHRASLRRHRP